MKKNPLPIALIAVLFLFTLACQALIPQKPGPTETSQRPIVKVATATIAQAENEPTEDLAGPDTQPTRTPEVVATRIPSRTPPANAEPLVVADLWFAQDNQSETMVWFAFFLENPNPDLAVVDTRFQVVGYDAGGAVLGKSDVDVPVIFPGERLGVAGLSPLIVPENTTVDKIEILTSREGKAQSFEFQGSPFEVDKVTYFHNQYRNLVSGVIHNLIKDGSLTNLAVSAIAYDADGKVIGAGSNTYIPFIPAGGSIGVTFDMQMTTDDIPARVEFYPTLYYGWDVLAVSEEGPTAEVLDTGFSQDEYGSVNYAFIAQNPNSDQALQFVQYQVTALDQNGNVLATSASSIGLMFPLEKMGFSSIISIPDDTEVARIEVLFAPTPPDQYDTWELEKRGLKANPLSAESPNYFDDEYNPKVTGIVKNSYDKEVYANVVVVAYSASGAIIGGGYTFVTIPAGGQAAIEVYMRVSEKPDRIEVYPSMASPPSD